MYIATPPYTHKEYTILAAKAGKAIYVEKPMALTFDSEVKNMLYNHILERKKWDKSEFYYNLHQDFIKKEFDIYLMDFKMHRDGKGANPREHR
ncbi:hypothetical protein CKY10_12325 [Photorhabdus sp. HUG-39]|uniref:Gfo/Idh/MocA family oxidoreductase n=1 Tax=Photorhabdus TaxID=29487 RepID=UPI000DCC1C0B|nr:MULTISPECIES: Gfo/Idh/MocA family oxidoreductase [Photorhabdus]RAX09234.1 hypothetical protein CKY10_12325 [Photorhabdus sp. HUG-39]